MTVAAVMTYDSLVNDIRTYLERTDDATLEKIPTFIMLAEQVLAAELKFLGNLIVVESNMVQGEAIIAKPARWRKTVSMNVTVAGKSGPSSFAGTSIFVNTGQTPQRPIFRRFTATMTMTTG